VEQSASRSSAGCSTWNHEQSEASIVAHRIPTALFRIERSCSTWNTCHYEVRTASTLVVDRGIGIGSCQAPGRISLAVATWAVPTITAKRPPS
jgi:hypothetical protein